MSVQERLWTVLEIIERHKTFKRKWHNFNAVVFERP